MAQKKDTKAANQTPSSAKADANSKADASQPKSTQSFREICEAIAIAIAVAFLFRTFFAEMFVIPTGSMAPTLCGRHKDVVCPKCGFAYQVGCSEEVRSKDRGNEVGVLASTCSNCGYTMNYRDELSLGKRNPSYTGDRIIVGKYPYHLSEPKRWDVAVFRYPGSASQNYIKRIVGLPNETLRIQNGDIYIQPFQPESTEAPTEPFRIARKPADKVLAMMQPVYNNDLQAKDLQAAKFPDRWAPVTAEGVLLTERIPNSWIRSEDGKEFTFIPSNETKASGWLGYRHILPTWEDWNQLGTTVLAPNAQLVKKPRLITDMTSYDTGEFAPKSEIVPTRGSQNDFSPTPKPSLDNYGLHWVGDLILECTVDVRTQVAGSKLYFGLVKAGKVFWCNIDLDSGSVELSIPALPDFTDSAASKKHIPEETLAEINAAGFYACRGESPMKGVNQYQFRFANVDNQLYVWVNGKVLKFDLPTAFIGLDESRPQAEDLMPVRIGCTGSEVKLSHLKLYRDIYYIAADDTHGGPLTDFPSWPQIPYHEGEYGFSPGCMDEMDFYTDPSRWDTFRKRRTRDFILANGQYFMMGDNSAASSDCRIWGCENYVREDLLVGRAFYVYWPHPWYHFIPNLPKCRMIH